MKGNDADTHVLNFFFTNHDKPVFVIRRTLPPEKTAHLLARYSRRHGGLREEFLSVLKEDEANYERLIDNITRIEGASQQIDDSLENALNSQVFLNKWALNFGHSSIAEQATITVCMEDVSILATKLIESGRLASYLEKSTRYVDFSKKSYYMDPLLENSEFNPEIEKTITDLFTTYEALKEPLIKRLGDEKKVFDSVRYLLPAGAKTMFGMSVNALQLARTLRTKMISSPLHELNNLGYLVREEAVKILPTLLKRAECDELYLKRNTRLEELRDKLRINRDANKERRVRLVDVDLNLENKVFAGMLYESSTPETYDSLLREVESLGEDDLKDLLEAYSGNEDEQPVLSRAFELVDFIWEIQMDYGAFRDLQRHRKLTVIPQKLTTFLGYETPAPILDAGLEEEYGNAMGCAHDLFKEVHGQFPDQAQYVVPLGYRVNFLWKTNLREAAYIIALRSGERGHDSYRSVARDMYTQLKEAAPSLSELINCY